MKSPGNPTATTPTGGAGRKRRLTNGGSTTTTGANGNQMGVGEEEYEAYENQRWSNSKRDWVIPTPPGDCPPWTTSSGEALLPLEEIEPPPEYGWVTNWKIDTAELAPGEGTRDREGWEYSTSFDRMVGGERRPPRGDCRWSDRARRRRWVRKMKVKTLLQDSRAVTELVKQAQEGLKGLVKGRLRLQELVDAIGKRRDSIELREKMWSVVSMVNQHSGKLETLLRSMDRDIVTSAKKLLNDFEKEKRQLGSLVADAERRDRATPVKATAGAPRTSSMEISSYMDLATPDAVTAGRTQFRFTGPTTSKTGEGVYVARDDQETQMMNRMQVMDEVEVNATIIEERAEAITEINKAVVELRDVFLDFAKLVHDQQSGIDAVEMNAEMAHANVERGLEHILKAQELQKNGTCILS